MPKFSESQEAADFIATAHSRETSAEIMMAIVFFAHDLAEAEKIWADGVLGGVVTMFDLWENITKNGAISSGEFYWGAASDQWAWPMV